jgi:hypothetical protein
VPAPSGGTFLRFVEGCTIQTIAVLLFEIVMPPLLCEEWRLVRILRAKLKRAL